MINSPVINDIKSYWLLARHDRPVGTWLIFLPALMGLTLGAQDLGVGIHVLLQEILIFFAGAFLIRGAGCTINDICDRDFDRQVRRTKTRILAKGDLSLKQAWFFLGIQLGLGALLLFFLRIEVFYLAFVAVILAVTYPLFKRFTALPQVYLGFCMNFSMLMAYVQMTGALSIDVIVLYIGTVFWTIYYDTIYAHMDREDDIKAGVKTLTLTKFGGTKWFLALCVGGFSLCLFTVVWARSFGFLSFIAFCVFVLVLIYQLKTLNIKASRNIYVPQCLKLFKANVYIGLLAWCALYL